MLSPISRYVFAVAIAVGVCRADIAHAQRDLPGPIHARLEHASLEWLVANCDVVVRGVVVDIAADQGNWNIVTLDVLETLKGAKAKRVKFAAHKQHKADATLAQAKKSKREQLWILKRQDSGVPGEAPDREKALARLKIDLHAPFLPGRPGAPSLPAIPLAPEKSDSGQAITFLTIDLQHLNTSDEIVKAIRTAIAEPQGREPVRSHSVTLPAEIAARTGFCGHKNVLIVPVDHRLEESARRLVMSPGDFLAKKYPDQIRLLRLEGVKTLRLFPSERNLAIVRTWLGDPMSLKSYKNDPPAPTSDLVPAITRSQQPERTVALPTDLAHVPEIHFQQPLIKALKTADAQLHTACTIDGVHLLNQKKTDAFIETLMRTRPDLAGLSFAMGDACRMKPEASREFVAALDVFRKAEEATASDKKQLLMENYKELARKRDTPAGRATPPNWAPIDSSVRVASLMQVLAPEDANARLGLAEYLDGIGPYQRDPCSGQARHLFRRVRNTRGGREVSQNTERQGLHGYSAGRVEISLACGGRAQQRCPGQIGAQGSDPRFD